jgi:hypothetical protein
MKIYITKRINTINNNENGGLKQNKRGLKLYKGNEKFNESIINKKNLQTSGV